MVLMKLNFDFLPNPGLELQPMAKIASGGELSRLMITLQQLISTKKQLPTILFDEIDTGVSGEVALKMGRMMKKMGATMQLLAISHLPQVAGMGEHHYKVLKGQKDGITETSIVRLNSEQRIDEIAGLMSGEELNEAAIENAKTLLSQS